MKRRIYAIMLSAAMALSLAACGKTETDSDVKESVVSEFVENTLEENVTSESASESETTSSEDSEPAEVYDFCGTIDGSTYVNKFFDIKIVAPEGYYFADEELLREFGEVASDFYKESDTELGQVVVDALSEGAIIVDLFLYDETFFNSININYMYLGPFGQLMTSEMYVDGCIPQIQNEYDAMGLSDWTVEKTTASWGGKEVPAMKVEGSEEYEDTVINFYILQIPIIKNGYGATVSIRTYLEDNTAELLGIVESIAE